MIQQSSFWAYTQTKLSFKKIHAPLCSQQQCSQQPRCGATYMFITRGMDNILVSFRVVKCARFNGERRLDNLIWKLSAKRPRKASKGYV